MANDSLINMTEIIDSLNQTLMSSVSPLITIFKAVGIVILIYIIFLIIRALFRWRTMAKISNTAKNVAEINSKLDILIEKIDKLGKKEKLKKEGSEQGEKKGIFKRLFKKSEKKEPVKKEKPKKKK